MQKFNYSNLIIINNQYHFTNSINQTLSQISNIPQINFSHYFNQPLLLNQTSINQINTFFKQNKITFYDINHNNKSLTLIFDFSYHTKQKIKNILKQYPQIKNYSIQIQNFKKYK